MHLNPNELCAYRDGELPPEERERASAHLVECTECRVQLAELEAQSARASAALGALAPSPTDAAFTPSKAAWRQLEPKLQEKQTMPNIFVRFRLLWAALIVVAILAVALSFPSVQALASNFLRLFRVQQVTVLPLDMTDLNDIRYDPTLGQTLSQALSSQVKITREGGKAFNVATAAEASQKAGFRVRVSRNSQFPLRQLTVRPGFAFEGTFDQSLALAVLESLGVSKPQIPAGVDGAVIKVNIPDGATANYGQCNKTDPDDNSAGSATFGITESCLLLVQVPSPTVDTPPDLPVTRLAELALTVLGMEPDKAAQFASQVDWTTTLVIPIPRGEIENKTVAVDGVQGQLLIQPADSTDLVPSYTLVWVKDGIVYAVLGTGDSAKGIALANSLE